ncbi:MAG: cadherin-like domain-containing protein [Paracoccaceae bacterium]
MSNSVTFIIEGDVDTRVTVTEVMIGDPEAGDARIVLQFDVEVLDTSGAIGDLRALFFDLEGIDVDDKSLSIVPVDNPDGAATPITGTAISEAGVSSLGRDTVMNGAELRKAGKFDVGVAFGTAGIGKDDVRSASFQIALGDGDLGLEQLALSDFGLRYTSVGAEGGRRDGSSKIVELDAVKSASDDSVTTLEDHAVSGNVLDNDQISGTVTSALVDLDGDGDEDPLVIGAPTEISDGGVPVGTLTLNEDGSFTFEPAPNYDGDVPEVSYTVTSPAGDTAHASLSIQITPVNDAPVGTPIGNETGRDAEEVVSIDVSGAFSDVDGDTLSYDISGLPAGLDYDPDTGVISGTIDNSASQGGSGGVYTVEVTASDGTLTATQSFTYTVENPAPDAANDTGATDEDVPLVVDAAAGLLANDSDPDGDDLAVTGFSVNGTTYAAGETAGIAGVGELTIYATGAYDFTPAENFNGPVPQVTYTISDGEGGTDTATLDLAVTGRNDPPEIDTIAGVEVFEAGLGPRTGDRAGDEAIGSGEIADGDPDNDSDTSETTTGSITFQPGRQRRRLHRRGHRLRRHPHRHPEFHLHRREPGPRRRERHRRHRRGRRSSSTRRRPPPTTATDGDDLAVTVLRRRHDLRRRRDATIPGVGGSRSTPPAPTTSPAENFNGPVPQVTYTISDGEGGTDTATRPRRTPVRRPRRHADRERDGFDADPVVSIASRRFSDVDGDTLSYDISGLPAGSTTIPTPA